MHTNAAAKLTRIVARDELADITARLAVITDELVISAPQASRLANAARRCAGAAVSNLTSEL